MRERLPIEIENLELPQDDFWEKGELNNSYGYVNILYILSIIITIGSVLVVIFFGK